MDVASYHLQHCQSSKDVKSYRRDWIRTPLVCPAEIAPDMTITLLGTISCGGPTETRNCSSLVLDALGTGSLWSTSVDRNALVLYLNPSVVDCAEGTVRQFAQQPYKDHRRLRISRLTKVLITHMHGQYSSYVLCIMMRKSMRPAADHTMGLITVLRIVLGIPKPAASHGQSITAPSSC